MEKPVIGRLLEKRRSPAEIISAGLRLLIFLFMVKLFGLVLGLAGQVDSQLAEGALVHMGQDDGGMGLAAPQLGQLAQGQLGGGVGGRADGQGHQDFIGVQARVPVAQMLDFQVLDGFDDNGGDEVDVFLNAAQSLQGVQQHGCGSAQQGGGFSCDNPSVRQLYGGGGHAGFFRPAKGAGNDGPVFGSDAGLVHQQLHLVDHLFAAVALALLAHGAVIAADDLLPGGPAAGLVVDDTVSGHIHAHIRGDL